jgi:S1-C subfamily serine protease
MRKVNGSNLPLAWAVWAALALHGTAAVAGQPNLTKMVADVATQIWPEGKRPAGSGFLVGAKGEILTAAHVIAGCKRVVARLGGATRLEASVIGVDTRLDAALLKTAAGSHAFLRLADAAPPEDAPLIVVARSVQTGTVARIAGNAAGMDPSGLLSVAAALAPGDSGAPVLDRYGNVAASVVGRLNDTPDRAVAVPAAALRPFLRYFGVQTNAAPAPSQRPALKAGSSRKKNKPTQLDPAVAAIECLK